MGESRAVARLAAHAQFTQDDLLLAGIHSTAGRMTGNATEGFRALVNVPGSLLQASKFCVIPSRCKIQPPDLRIIADAAFKVRSSAHFRDKGYCMPSRSESPLHEKAALAVALGYDELELLVLPQEGELHGGGPRFLIPEPIKQGMELRAECGSRHAARRLFFSLRLVAPGARGGTNESSNGVGTKWLLN